MYVKHPALPKLVLKCYEIIHVDYPEEVPKSKLLRKNSKIIQFIKVDFVLQRRLYELLMPVLKFRISQLFVAFKEWAKSDLCFCEVRNIEVLEEIPAEDQNQMQVLSENTVILPESRLKTHTLDVLNVVSTEYLQSIEAKVSNLAEIYNALPLTPRYYVVKLSSDNKDLIASIESFTILIGMLSVNRIWHLVFNYLEIPNGWEKVISKYFSKTRNFSFAFDFKDVKPAPINLKDLRHLLFHDVSQISLKHCPIPASIDDYFKERTSPSRHPYLLFPYVTYTFKKTYLLKMYFRALKKDLIRIIHLDF
uniref:Uncharacterized protein n=1 Tax=Panagrolaimus sp. JU765 TaxID=591449 RepID=A0AC34PVS6_9BILA